MNKEGAHQFLDVLLNLRRACEREGYTGVAVESLLRECLLFVRRDIMGEDVFRRALLRARGNRCSTTRKSVRQDGASARWGLASRFHL
jgi:hypothetical protein